MEAFDPSITGVTADHPQNEAIHTTLTGGNLHAIHTTNDLGGEPI